MVALKAELTSTKAKVEAAYHRREVIRELKERLESILEADDNKQGKIRELRHSLDWANAEIERLGGDPNNIGPHLWQDWDGGDCPIPEGKWCIVINREGTMIVSQAPENLAFHNNNRSDYDIVKYIVIPPTDTGGEG